MVHPGHDGAEGPYRDVEGRNRDYKAELKQIKIVVSKEETKVMRLQEQLAMKEGDKYILCMLQLWRSLQSLVLPIRLLSTWQLFAWDHACLLIALTAGHEPYEEIKQVTWIVLEVIWSRGEDDLCALISFCVLQGDIIPDEDYHKFMALCGDATCWQALYFVRLHYWLLEREVQQMSRKEWTMLYTKNLPKHNNSQVLRAAYMKELWECTLVQLQHCLAMLKSDVAHATRVVQEGYDATPTTMEYKMNFLLMVVSTGQLSGEEVLRTRKPPGFFAEYADENTILALKEKYWEWSQTKQLLVNMAKEKKSVKALTASGEGESTAALEAQ